METANLVDDPAYAGRVSALREELETCMPATWTR